MTSAEQPGDSLLGGDEFERWLERDTAWWVLGSAVLEAALLEQARVAARRCFAVPRDAEAEGAPLGASGPS